MRLSEVSLRPSPETKTNNAGHGRGYPDWLRPYLYNPGGEGLGKPFRAWYVHITKEKWAQDPKSAK